MGKPLQDILNIYCSVFNVSCFVKVMRTFGESPSKLKLFEIKMTIKVFSDQNLVQSTFYSTSLIVLQELINDDLIKTAQESSVSRSFPS